MEMNVDMNEYKKNCDEVWNAIHELSDIRAAYSVFDPDESKKYHALSMGIEALRSVIGE